MSPKPPRQDVPEAPRGLSADSREQWRRIHAGWVVDDGGRLILETGLRARELATELRAIIQTEGYLVPAGKAGRKPHPLLRALHDADLRFMKAMRQLGLDVEPPGSVGRPPGKRCS